MRLVSSDNFEERMNYLVLRKGWMKMEEGRGRRASGEVPKRRKGPGQLLQHGNLHCNVSRQGRFARPQVRVILDLVGSAVMFPPGLRPGRLKKMERPWSFAVANDAGQRR
jgi:hypothetical protein